MKTANFKLKSIPILAILNLLCFSFQVFSDTKHKYSFLASDTGKIVLRGIEVKEHKIVIRINSGGCTDKSSIKALVNKTTGLVDKDVNHYTITFVREKPDYCKAFLPDGATIEYDLKKDFGIKTEVPYTVTVENPVYPFLREEPHFIIFPKEEKPIAIDEKLKLKENLLKTTIKAIEMEISRYQSSQHSDKEEKLKFLREELTKYQNKRPENYRLDSLSNKESSLSIKHRVLESPLVKEELVKVEKPLKLGEILEVVGMTKSGPFYHVAGINPEVEEILVKEGGLFKVKLYLVYKREYFGFIPNFYVYVAEAVKK